MHKESNKDHDKIWNIIDNVVMNNMNDLPHLFGKPKKEVTKEKIYSKLRDKEYVVCRQLAQYLADYIFNDILNEHMTLEMIGYRFSKDHATVIHSIKTIKNYRDQNVQILNLICGCIDIIIRRIKLGEGNKQPHRFWTWLYPKSQLF